MIKNNQLFFYLIIILFLFLFIVKISNECIEKISNECIEKRLSIVYFIYINHDKNWQYIVESQLNDIIESNILSIATLNIVVVDEKEIIDKTYFDNIIKKNKYNIEFHNKNHFEYWGIKKLYELSQKEPDKIYLYLHSKGMVFNSEERSPIEKYLTKDNKGNEKFIFYINNEILHKHFKNGRICGAFAYVLGIRQKQFHSKVKSKIYGESTN